MTPTPAYSAWIAAYLERRNGCVLGECHRGTAEMQTAFPELKQIRGHVYTLSWGKRGHVWLEAPDGTIVDPTASQFPVILSYEPWVPGCTVRVGKCMNCGEEIWEALESLEHVVERCVCSDECDLELRREYA